METERDYERRLAASERALKFLEEVKRQAVEEKKAKENKVAIA